MKHLQFILTISFLLFIHLGINAQCDDNNIFFADDGNDWSTASNWQFNCVPTSPIVGHISIFLDCTISSDTPAYIFNSGSYLQINTGVTLTNNSTSDFTFNGNITGDGTYKGNLNLIGNTNISPGNSFAPL